MVPGNAVGTLTAIAARNAQTVIPAKAAIQTVSTPLPFHAMDSRLRGNDDRGWYEVPISVPPGSGSLRPERHLFLADGIGLSKANLGQAAFLAAPLARLPTGA